MSVNQKPPLQISINLNVISRFFMFHSLGCCNFWYYERKENRQTIMGNPCAQLTLGSCIQIKSYSWSHQHININTSDLSFFTKNEINFPIQNTQPEYERQYANLPLYSLNVSNWPNKYSIKNLYSTCAHAWKPQKSLHLWLIPALEWAKCT